MAAKVLLAASHLFVVASSAFFGANPALRQQLPEAQRLVTETRLTPPLTFAASDGRSPEDVRRLEGLIYDLAKKVKEQKKAGGAPEAAAGNATQVAGEANNSAIDFEVSAMTGNGGSGEIERLDEIVTGLLKKKRQQGEKTKHGKATPMDGTAQYIKNMIDNIMIPNREMAHKRDQASLDTAVQNVHRCEQSKVRQMRHAEAPKATYEDASSQHSNCRLTESGEYLEKADQCRDSMMQVKRMQRDMTCDKVAVVRESCKYSNYQAITDAEMECARAKKKVVYAEKLCDQVKARYNQRVATCDHWQSIMDEASCKHAMGVKDVCQESDRCFKSLFPIYLSTLKAVERDELDRGAEWRALKRLQCLVDSFENGVTDQEVDDCKAKSHYPPSIAYPEAPEAKSCVVPGKYPGTDAYHKAEFAHLPPQAKGNPDAGQCYGMSL